MQENEKEMLYIPLGLKTRTEIFDGFGKDEMFQAIVFNIGAVLFDLMLYVVFRSVTGSIIFIITAIAASIMALTKDKSNISVLDQIRFLIRFANMQKKYPYKALNEWKV